MEADIPIPDFVTDFSRKPFETKPGIQFAGKIAPRAIRPGENSYLIFVVQNALDAQVEGSINITLPSRKLFTKTNLSTVSPVRFLLDNGEAERILIPIVTSSSTPEGEYEVEILIEGSGGRGGKRIREKRDGKNWGKAVARSVAESVAISAVGLLFGGVGVRVYTPSNRLKTSISVKGKPCNPANIPIEVIREKLWYKSDYAIYQLLAKWARENLQKWGSNYELKNQVVTVFCSKLSSAFEDIGYNLSNEEVLWLGGLTAFLYFNWDIVNTQKLCLIALKNARDLSVRGECPKEGLLLEKLSFEGDVIKRWLDNLQDKDFLKVFSFFMSMFFAGAHDKASDSSFVKEGAQRIFDEFAGKSQKQKVMMFMVPIFLAYAIRESNSIFPKSEIEEHLLLLKESVNNNELFEKQRKGLTELIEKEIARSSK
jgi:hypothetical protein